MCARRELLPALVCLALLAAGCAGNPSSQGEPRVDATAQAPPGSPFRASPASRTLPGGCAEDVVGRRMAALADAVSRGDGAAVATHFLGGPDLRWEVDDYADAPNGTRGALRTTSAIAAVTRAIHARDEVWVPTHVAAPTHRVEGGPAVYAVGISITSGRTTRVAGAKAVIDCATGRVRHMVGPGT